MKNVELNGERYIVCFNPQEAERDRKVREEVIKTLETKLSQDRNSLIGNSGYRKYLKMDKEALNIDQDKIKQEARYDRKYVLRTNTTLDTSEVALAYKELWKVERAFRDLKSSLDIRPVYHWTESRIRSHVMVCFLAFYLECILARGSTKYRPRRA